MILSNKRSEFTTGFYHAMLLILIYLLKIIPQRNPHTPLLIFLAPWSKNEKSKNKKYLLFNEKKKLKTHISTYLSQHYPRKPYAHIIPDFLFENNPIPYQSFKARF